MDRGPRSGDENVRIDFPRDMPQLSDEASRIYSETISGRRGITESLMGFVGTHTTSVSALRERERFMGVLDGAERAVLEHLEREVTPAIVETIRHILRTQVLPPEDVLTLSRAGRRLDVGPPVEDTAPRSFHERYGLPDPGFDLRRVRSDVRVARSMSRTGELNQDFAGLSTTVRSALEEESERLRADYNNEASKREGADPDRLESISRRLTSTDRLRQEIVNLFELNAERQRSAYNQVLGGIGTIFSALGVAQFVGRIAISEPYKYVTQPSLQMLGRQGEMGAVLGNAFSEVEARNVELNQLMLGTGYASTFAGAAMALGRGPVALRALGAALSVGGLAMGASGVFGVGDDFLKSIGFKPDSLVLGQALAKQFSDPTRLLNEFQTSRAGLLAVGAGSAYNMGFQTSGVRSYDSTGNPYLDRMISLGGRVGLVGEDGAALTGEDGNERDVSVLRALQHNRETLGALLSESALTLTNTGPGLEAMAVHAAQVGGLYGIGDTAALSAMQTAQRFGSRDAIQTYKQYAGVFAESDGSISSYSMDVLVPALLKVTESMAMRNLARTTEDLTQEVTSFGRTVITSDSRLGELARVNPEIIGRVLTGLQESGSMGMQDVAMAALDMSLGSTMADIFLGRASVSDRRMQFLLQQAGLSGGNFGSVDSFLNSSAGLAVARYAQGNFSNLSPQDLLALVELSMSGSILGTDGELDLDKIADEDLRKRIESLGASPLSNVANTMSQQVDEFMTVSSGLISDLQKLQKVLLGFMSHPALGELMRKSLEKSEGVVSGVSGTLDTIQKGVELDRETAAWEELLALPESQDFMKRMEGEVSLIPLMHGAGDGVYARLLQAALNDTRGFGERVLSLRTPEDVQQLYEELPPPLPSHSSGGFTGLGGRHQVAGVVHAGEYVISSNNVPNNLQILNRIQSGETVSESSISQSSGNVTYVTMRVHGMSSDDIQNTVRRVTEDYITRNRLNYV